MKAYIGTQTQKTTSKWLRTVHADVKTNGLHTQVNKWKHIFTRVYSPSRREWAAKQLLLSHCASFTAQLTAASWCESQQQQPACSIINQAGSGFNGGNPFLTGFILPSKSNNSPRQVSPSSLYLFFLSMTKLPPWLCAQRCDSQRTLLLEFEGVEWM